MRDVNNEALILYPLFLKEMQKNTTTLFLILLLVTIGAFVYFTKRQTTYSPAVTSTEKRDATRNNGIDALTSETVVVAYLKKHNRLPDYYITKSEAREKGWAASEGNLCEVLPGKAIGGDIFTNREEGLPKAPGRKWFEADLNYHCGRRNADRVLFSSDGLIFTTHDHYQTFQQQ